MSIYNILLLKSIIKYLYVLRQATNVDDIRYIKILFNSTTTKIILLVEFDHPYGYRLPLKNYTNCVEDTIVSITASYRIYDLFRYAQKQPSETIT